MYIINVINKLRISEHNKDYFLIQIGLNRKYPHDDQQYFIYPINTFKGALSQTMYVEKISQFLRLFAIFKSSSWYIFSLLQLQPTMQAYFSEPAHFDQMNTISKAGEAWGVSQLGVRVRLNIKSEGEGKGKEKYFSSQSSPPQAGLVLLSPPFTFASRRPNT